MQQELIFVKALKGTSKSGYEYDFVVVSNGIQSGTLSNPKHIEFSDYKEGDSITLKLNLKPNGKSFDIEIIDKVE